MSEPFTFRGCLFMLPDEGVPSDLLAHYRDEQDVRDAYWLIERGDVVIDVGAMWGRYTIPALACGAKVMAVDPDLSALSVLRSVAAFNRFTGPVEVNAAAFDGGSYPNALSVQIRASAQASMTPGPHARWVSLDHLTRSLPKVDWVKVDVEGGELGVLRGARELLQRDHPRLLIEDHTKAYRWVREQDSRAAILRLLEQAGYEPRFVPYRGQNDYLIAA